MTAARTMLIDDPTVWLGSEDNVAFDLSCALAAALEDIMPRVSKPH